MFAIHAVNFTCFPKTTITNRCSRFVAPQQEVHNLQPEKIFFNNSIGFLLSRLSAASTLAGAISWELGATSCQRERLNHTVRSSPQLLTPNSRLSTLDSRPHLQTHSASPTTCNQQLATSNQLDSRLPTPNSRLFSPTFPAYLSSIYSAPVTVPPV